MVFYRERDSDRPPLSLILPYLYLGAESDVTQDCLTSQGITYVLSVSRCCPQPAFLPQKQYLRIPIDDSLRDELLPWIPEALQFIDGAMSRGCSVLVHCVAGVSRSPALAVAYVMYRLGLGLDDAYRFVKERRPSISPNFNFLGQLQSFQGTLAHKGCGANQKEVPAGVDSGLLGNLLSPSQNTCIQNPVGNNSFSGIYLEGVKMEAHCDGVTVNSLNKNSVQLHCTEREDNRSAPMTLNVNRHHQKVSTKPNLPLSDKLRFLTLSSTPNEAEGTCPIQNQEQNPFGNSQSKPLRPAHLDVSSAHVSLSEKRKSLKLSLTPLGLNSPTLQSAQQEREHNNSDQQWHHTGMSKTAQKREAGPSNSMKKQSKKSQSALGLGESGVQARRKSQQMWGIKSSPKTQSKRETAGSSIIVSAQTEEGNAASSISADSGLNLRDSTSQARGENENPSKNQQQVAPDSHCTPAIEVVEGLDVEQVPLSPLSITVNKLIGWGERMLLGVLLGPRVKVGQAALPYSC